MCLASAVLRGRGSSHDATRAQAPCHAPLPKGHGLQDAPDEHRSTQFACACPNGRGPPPPSEEGISSRPFSMARGPRMPLSVSDGSMTPLCHPSSTVSGTHTRSVGMSSLAAGQLSREVAIADRPSRNVLARCRGVVGCRYSQSYDQGSLFGHFRVLTHLNPPYPDPKICFLVADALIIFG